MPRTLRLSPRAVAAGAVSVLVSVAVPVSAATTSPTAAALPLRALTRDVLPAHLLRAPGAPVDHAAPAEVGVTVAGRDAAGLTRLLAAQYDPSSADYHRWLTPAEYQERFGAAPAVTAQVRRWLGGAGLRIRYANPAGTFLVADGTVGQVEATFRVDERHFRAGAVPFTANTTAPTVPSAVTSVSGLDSLSNTAHRAALRALPRHLGSSGGVAAAVPGALRHSLSRGLPFAAITNPQDLWSVYEQPASDTGQGEHLAAFGWGSPGPLASDLRQFEAEKGLPVVPLSIDTVGTPNSTDLSGLGEWDLDSQAATGMAPNAAGMTFYFVNSGTETLIAQGVQTWADDPHGAVQASGSYGLCDALGLLGTFDSHEQALTQAAAEGRSFFASTGDNGSGCSALVNTNGITIGPVPSPEYPATSPHAIAVGGTVLYTTGSPATRQEEIAWTHGGAGVSYTYPAPAWQSGSTSAVGSTLATAGRLTADVSAQSGDLTSGYNVVSNGADTSEAGTSLSAPLWQGMWARVSAAAPVPASGGDPRLGFAAPLIYRLNADATRYSTAFTDIVVGADGLYTAAPGYDLPTGWGVPRVSGLIKLLDGTLTPTTTGGSPTPSGGSTSSPTPSPTAPSLPLCPAYPQWTDPAGDATQLAVADTGQSAANQPDLDLRSGGVTYDGSTMTLHAVVSNLSATPGTGEYLRFAFSHGGVSYEVDASRAPTGTTATWQSGSGATGTALGTLTGVAFDTTTNEIRVALPSAVYSAAQPSQTPLGGGSTVSGITVTAQRYAGVLTLTADTAATTGNCAVPLGLAPTASPTPTTSATPTGSTTSTPTPTTSATPSTTGTSTPTPTPTATRTVTPSPTGSASPTPTCSGKGQGAGKGNTRHC